MPFEQLPPPCCCCSNRTSACDVRHAGGRVEPHSAADLREPCSSVLPDRASTCCRVRVLLTELLWPLRPTSRQPKALRPVLAAAARRPVVRQRGAGRHVRGTAALGHDGAAHVPLSEGLCKGPAALLPAAISGARGTSGAFL